VSGLDHGWDKGEKPNHADFIHGGVPIEDFDEDVRIGHPKRRKKKVKRKNYPGCPANNRKGHVWVWTEEFERENTLCYRYFGFHEYERKVCCGCGHRDASRRSEAYRARKEKMWAKYRRSYSRYRWWTWESYDEGYQAYRKDYIAKHGFTNAVWNW